MKNRAADRRDSNIFVENNVNIPLRMKLAHGLSSSYGFRTYRLGGDDAKLRTLFRRYSY